MSLDNGTLNEPVSADNLVYTFEMPASDVIVKVEFRYVAPYVPPDTSVQPPEEEANIIQISVNGIL